MPRSKKPAAAPVAPAIDPAVAAAIAAAVKAALAGIVPGTVALATAAPAAPPAPKQEAAPVVMANPRVTIGSFTAEGWIGKKGNMLGRFGVTVSKGRGFGGLNLSCMDEVDELESDVISQLVEACCNAAGKKLGGK
jgi:hypothetical protein